MAETFNFKNFVNPRSVMPTLTLAALFAWTPAAAGVGSYSSPPQN